MSSGDLATFCRFCADTPAPFIRVGGGEALLHPQFRAFMDEIMDLGKPVELGTNGLLLPRHEWLFDEPRVRAIHVSVYPEINDYIIERYKGQSKLNCIKFRSWFDAFYDPKYSPEDALALYNSCPCTLATVVGRKVYGCGTAEPLERHLSLPSLSIPLREGWMQEFEQASNLEVCAHCFTLSGAKTSAIGPTKDKGETFFDHDGVFC
jgi:hypothetical protein